MKFIKNLICWAVLAAAIYSGYKFGMPYYRYFALRSDLKDIITFNFKPDVLKPMIIEKIRERDVPLGENDVQIVFGEQGRVSLKASWHETVNLADVYSKRLDFSLDLSN